MKRIPDTPLHLEMVDDRYWSDDQHISPPPTWANKLRYKVAVGSVVFDRLVHEFAELTAGDSIRMSHISEGKRVPPLGQEQPGLMQLIIDDRIRGKVRPYRYMAANLHPTQKFEEQAYRIETEPLYAGPNIATELFNKMVMRSVVYVRGYDEPGWVHAGAEGSSIEQMLRRRMSWPQGAWLLGGLVVGRTETVDYGAYVTDTRVSYAAHVTPA
ncbi:MAG TPA: hypothetical protein VLF43_01195 [Candidatus Saccharimonadales bacterium]|nr:hypothetical protein [Candidatus Saccharimonadales bacterium]